MFKRFSCFNFFLNSKMSFFLDVLNNQLGVACTTLLFQNTRERIRCLQEIWESWPKFPFSFLSTPSLNWFTSRNTCIIFFFIEINSFPRSLWELPGAFFNQFLRNLLWKIEWHRFLPTSHYFPIWITSDTRFPLQPPFHSKGSLQVSDNST